jgi:hypothetical protein
MGKEITGILSDNRDYKLLGLVNDVLDRRDSFQYLKNVLYPHLGPRDQRAGGFGGASQGKDSQRLFLFTLTVKRNT